MATEPACERDADGRIHAIETDHVLAATGYRVRLDAVDFLAPELLAVPSPRPGGPDGTATKCR
ncbi:hypothetical protein [Streptomyces sp. NPDC058457]|uniref:hypothetical protein n=1 Tax=Streptomyces sp. NPDC058457 TaxID=3346507 RepID=UPI00365E4760